MKKIVVWVRSTVLGWAALLAIAYGVERPVVGWTAPLFGPVWIATAHLAFDCLTLAAAGYVAGRLNRARAVLSAAMFAVTLCCWDFGGAVALDVPLLLQMVWDCLHDSRYLDSAATSAGTHVLLFGCLIAGAVLSRAGARPVSIVG